MLDKSTLQEFFSRAIVQACSAHKVSLSEHATHYLTQLLSARSRPQRLPVDTLAELHMSAAQAPRHQALRLYRSLGDRALYVTGFFPESLNNKAVGVPYYERMGRSAYVAVATIGRDSAPFSEMFEELGQQFSECRKLLADVSEAARAASSPDLMSLYEDWLRTQSRHAARRLAELGVLATTPEESAA